MKEYASEHPEEDRLLGIGWFPSNWGDAPLPSKKSLDEAFPDKPVYLMAADVHTLWMNTKALEESLSNTVLSRRWKNRENLQSGCIFIPNWQGIRILPRQKSGREF